MVDSIDLPAQPREREQVAQKGWHFDQCQAVAFLVPGQECDSRILVNDAGSEDGVIPGDHLFAARGLDHPMGYVVRRELLLVSGGAALCTMNAHRWILP